MTAIRTAAERLADLLTAARAGEPVTPEELATARSEADAETEITHLRQTGEAERERERAERQRIADKAAAAATARDELPAARDNLRAHYDALAVLLADLTTAHQHYEDTIKRQVKALTDAGHVGITSYRREWEIADLPDYDATIVPNADGNTVKLDGVHYRSGDAGLGIVWTAMRAGHYPSIDRWKRSGDTRPLDPPLPELGNNQ
ncbi:hypothetical protein MYP14_04725 [Rhodococcus pyridinivorans]|uniref:hypothetical protein n=1 Tax=Rhodococcus pyridinivorans TaxID=103816 RepID=UPI001FFFFEF4|nr:hypothetical protein [Rhodococcus pyridinivorans]UPK64671.1 hypothetical protein MYP14_04725 [Rhodococcus pyridinivorans]